MSQVPLQLTPSSCFVVSMFYLITADGRVDPEEIGYMSSILGGKRQDGGVSVQHSAMVDGCLHYVKHHSMQEFLREVNHKNLLNPEQKLFILVHLLDISYSDGRSESEEGKVITYFKEALGVSNESFLPYFSMIKFKNNRALVGL